MDLADVCAAHVEGPLRRWPNGGSACRSCSQPWPCDASLLATELRLLETAHESSFAVIWSGSTVLVRFQPGQLHPERALELDRWLKHRRPDIDWLIVEADDVLAFAPLPEESSDAHCHEEASQTDEEGHQADAGRQGP